MLRPLLSSTVLLAVVLGGLSATPAAADTPGSLEVTVSGGGAPLEGATVTLHRFDEAGVPQQDFFAGGLTDAAGSVSLVDVAAGVYAVELTPPQGSAFLPEWLGNATTPFTAERITVASDAHVAVSEDLARGGFISGRVRADAARIPIVWVFARTVSLTGAVLGAAANTTALPDGSYLVGPLPPGRYAVEAVAPRGGAPRAWWPAASTPESAGTVAIRGPETRTAVDLRLGATGATLSGSVTTVVGGVTTPITGLVEVLTRAGSRVADGAIAEGAYTVADIPPGTYVIRFSVDPLRNPYGVADEYWTDAATLGAARSLTIRPGSAASADAILDARPAIVAQPATPATFARAGDVLDGRPRVETPGVTLTYQWYQRSYADSTATVPRAPIPGATGPTLRITRTHAGTAVSVVVTVSRAGYAAREIESTPTTLVLDAPPTGVLPVR